MKIVTIILDETDDAMPPTVHLSGLNQREAVCACAEAYDALYAELPDMVIETSSGLTPP